MKASGATCSDPGMQLQARNFYLQSAATQEIRSGTTPSSGWFVGSVGLLCGLSLIQVPLLPLEYFTEFSVFRGTKSLLGMNEPHV